jgi:hypothetical protein
MHVNNPDDDLLLEIADKRHIGGKQSKSYAYIYIPGTGELKHEGQDDSPALHSKDVWCRCG